MISARSSKFRGGGGILRKKDGTLLDIQFTDVNPLWDGKPKPKPVLKPGEKAKPEFHALYGVLSIQEDGREEVTQQPLFVGDADQFEVVCDGRGLKGDGQLSKSSDFYIFLNSLSNPTDGGDGFDEENFPEDPEGLVADFSPMVGARVQFDWLDNPAKTKKLGQRTVKGKDGKPDQKYNREDLVVASYYGQVEVSAPAPAKAKPTPGRLAGTATKAPSAAKAGKAGASSGTDIAALASVKVVECLKAAKGHELSINRLSVKLLGAMSQEPDTREDVRKWALDAANLGGISADYAPEGFEGVVYDQATQTISLVAE